MAFFQFFNPQITRWTRRSIRRSKPNRGNQITVHVSLINSSDKIFKSLENWIQNLYQRSEYIEKVKSSGKAHLDHHFKIASRSFIKGQVKCSQIKSSFMGLLRANSFKGIPMTEQSMQGHSAKCRDQCLYSFRRSIRRSPPLTVLKRQRKIHYGAYKPFTNIYGYQFFFKIFD